MSTIDPPLQRLLEGTLLAAPLGYLMLDCAYAARGWGDGATGGAQVLAAALYGIAALALVTLARGRAQVVLLVVAMLGVVGNAAVGVNTMHLALGGIDLFHKGGVAGLFKVLGFFFPLTFLIAAIVVRGRTPRWWPPLLALGALLFPVAHVANISWLAIVDGVVMLAALGSLTGRRATAPDLARRSAEPRRAAGRSRARSAQPDSTPRAVR